MQEKKTLKVLHLMLNLVELMDDLGVFPGFSSLHSPNCMFSYSFNPFSVVLANICFLPGPYSRPQSVIHRWCGFSVSVSRAGGLATQHLKCVLNASWCCPLELRSLRMNVNTRCVSSDNRTRMCPSCFQAAGADPS